VHWRQKALHKASKMLASKRYANVQWEERIDGAPGQQYGYCIVALTGPTTGL
jgi:hypothetical protein